MPSEGGTEADETNRERAMAIKPYVDTASELKNIQSLGSEIEADVRELYWMALGGRGMSTREEAASKLRALARRAEATAEDIEQLDDPREKREELTTDE